VLSFFNVTRTHNLGISLGPVRADSEAARWVLVAVTAGIALSMLVWICREPRPWRPARARTRARRGYWNILDG